MEILLIPLLLCVTPLLIGWIIWRFTFKRSAKKVLMAVIAALLNRQDTVDLDAPIPVPHRGQHISDMLDDMADDTSQFDAQLLNKNLNAQKAGITREEEVSSGTSSDNGWPVRVDNAIRRMRHPFRRIRLETENEARNEDLYHGDA